MKLNLAPNSALKSKDFTYGVATASFQIEGNLEGRLPCIWDTFCGTPGKIKDGSNGEIACDHIRLWEQDIDLIESLGVDAYRFSVSWPRLINQDGSLNDKGLDFYLALLDRLNQKNIKPFVTLYHWDLPQYLEDIGGWLNRDTAYRFQDYADIVSRKFGDRVFSYATLNEPFCSAYLGYEAGIHAPGKIGKQFGKKAAHHLLLAHGLGMQALQQNSPNSKNGIVLNFTPAYPETGKEEDVVACEWANQNFNDWYIKPLFDKSYPPIIEEISEEERPQIKDGDMEIIAQPLDFLGVNFYTRAVYRADKENRFKEIPPQNVPVTEMGWEIYPQAFTNLLTSLNHRYALPEIYITENGSAMNDAFIDGEVNDVDRIEYLQAHLEALDQAIAQGVNVKGYFAWSLMDNFEWAEGYLKRFGIVYVDYLNQQRIIKLSGKSYRDFISNR
ncbi:MAG: GH1 family beta-glucosidase [Kangiellaceae bacterium]|nr:GH1 family beta-glucosidase [Kangiellaceae bacterium]MCW9017772.1 GH1 family beta-glucosidase [Kangiellaceae bacterium]